MTAQVLHLRDRQPAANLTPAEARRLTDRIRASVAKLLPLIKEAFDRRADVALGYTTWTDYCDAELRGIRLPINDRREAVAELRQAGLSTRAIGSALGVGQTQVIRDLNRLNTEGSDGLPERITSLDGRERPAARPTDVPAGPDAASPPAASEPPGRPGTQVTPVGVDGGGVTRDAGAPAPRQEVDPTAAVAAAIEAHLPADPNDRFREWRRGFMADVGATYRVVSRHTVDEVAERADDECVAELERAAAELAWYVERVKRLRAESRPDNVIPLGRS